MVDQSTGERLAVISDLLINPDNGSIEGFFVVPIGGLRSATDDLFLSTMDILRWGKSVTISALHAIAPASEMIRLERLLNDPRTVLGQKILSERGRRIGRCQDVQFNTKTWKIEWLFPRRWWSWGVAYPVSDVLEVRPDAIIVKDEVSIKEPVEVVQPEEEVDLASGLVTPSTRSE